jgi:hypothetical protein
MSSIPKNAIPAYKFEGDNFTLYAIVVGIWVKRGEIEHSQHHQYIIVLIAEGVPNILRSQNLCPDN